MPVKIPDAWLSLTVSGTRARPRVRGWNAAGEQVLDMAVRPPQPDGPGLPGWAREFSASLRRQPARRDGPITVFVSVTGAVPKFGWAQAFRKSLGTVSTGFQFIRQTPANALRPLRLLAFGADAAPALHWVARKIPPRGRAGAVVLALDSPDDAALEQHTTKEPPEIVVVADPTAWLAARKVYARLARLKRPRGRLPRLIVLVGEAADVDTARGVPPPVGSALLRLPPSMNARASAVFLRRLVERLNDDLPLHAAVHAAWRDARGRPGDRPLLSGDPLGNQTLRRPDLPAKASQTRKRGTGKKMGAGAPPSRSPRSPARARPGGTRFTNFTPMSEGSGDFSFGFGRPAGDGGETVRRIIPPRTPQRPPPSEPANPSRSLDLWLLAYDPAGEPVPHPPDQSLLAGGRYSLQMKIDRELSPESLFRSAGDSPSLDPLLPEPDPTGAWTLQAALFASDFTLDSAPVQPLRLPRTGGSNVVAFEVVAPAKLGLARMRVSLYYRNVLLASYAVEAGVAGTGAVVARCDFTQTANFTNLRALEPRALSLNYVHLAGTHRLMLSADGQAAEVIWPEEQMRTRPAEFRAILENASWDKNFQARFATDPATGDPGAVVFDQAIRQLADLGGQLYGSLLDKTPAWQPALHDLRATRDRTLQIVQLDPTYAFPWTILYDYEAPEQLVGDPPPPVCPGVGASGEGRCDCPAEGGAGYCLNGFWGVRHRLETQVATDGMGDAVLAIAPPHAGLRWSVDVPDARTQEFTATMLGRFGDRQFAAPPPPDAGLLTTLWGDGQRPAVVALLGHLETRDKPHEPPGPRLVLAPGTRWLRPQDVQKLYLRNGQWQSPQPLVFLLACGAGATDVTRLVTFSSVFLTAGAAGVVGPECRLAVSLAVRFARFAVEGLWAGKGMGQVMQEFRRDCAAARNPLGFVFTYLGSAQLRLLT